MNALPLPISINTHGVTIGEVERRHIDLGRARLDAWTRRFTDRFLQLNVRRHDRDDVHTVNLVLELPNKTIVAHDSAPFLLAAVDRAFRKAARQVREFKSILRRDHLHRKVRQARSVLPTIPEAEVSQAAQDRDLEEFRSRARSHVGRLTHFLGREVQHLIQRDIQLDTTVEDLVEETLVQALERFGEKPWSLPSSSWLYAMATDVLEQHASQASVSTVSLSGNGDVPEPPSDDDDVFDGLQRLLFRGESPERSPPSDPEAAELRVLASAPADPVEQAEESDLQQRVAELLPELPNLWRRAFLLHFVEGFDFQEIAQIQGLNEDQVRFNIRSAEFFLRERLTEGERRRVG